MQDSTRKNIGIVTFLSSNYGALLQAYALQRYLKKVSNHNIVNIDFRRDVDDDNAKIFNLYGSLKTKIGQIVFTLLRYNGLSKRRQRIRKFKQKYFTLTPTYRSADDFLNKPPVMDIYISGSDQVFNPNSKYIDVYYLNFKKKNALKVAYAASFGISNFTDEISQKISLFVKDFDLLSCREEEGAKYLSNISNKEAQWVVDPTLLLTKEEWLQISVAPKIKDKYIFIYGLAGEDYLINIARKIKGKTGYKIVFQTNTTRNFYKSVKQIYDSGPSELIGWIKNAEYVVTDSFHGTVFSVIFEKSFFTFVSRPKLSSRIYNLIDLLGIPECIITQENLKRFTFNNSNTRINKNKINQMIENSKMFIQSEIIDEKE